jgi:hypothetical protein
MNKPNSGLDKNIEFELLEKMKTLNQNEIKNSKLSLKPEELTFSNILENNYGFHDINESFSKIDAIDITDITDNISDTKSIFLKDDNIDSLDNLLF